MEENFRNVNEQHTYNTRSSQNNFGHFVIPKIKGVESTTFYYNAIKDWNSLPGHIKETKNLDQFKKSVKSYLINSYKDI